MIQSVEVRWPSGRLDRWTDLTADTGYLLREGDAADQASGWFLATIRRARKGLPRCQCGVRDPVSRTLKRVSGSET